MIPSHRYWCYDTVTGDRYPTFDSVGLFYIVTSARLHQSCGRRGDVDKLTTFASTVTFH